MAATQQINFGAFQSAFKVQRRVKSPMDKCTIVSVFPQAIVDYKPTAFPQTHRIEAAEDNDFSIAVVESAGYFREMENENFLEIPIPSHEVARAFIQDNTNSLPEYVPDVAAPGLFYVYGAHTKESLKKYEDPETGLKFDQMLAKARERQKNWFTRLVNATDSDWSRTNGNPKSVSQLARLAAEKIGIKDKPWMMNFSAIERSACPACGQFINLAFPVCPNCKVVIDQEKATKLGLKFAS